MQMQAKKKMLIMIAAIGVILIALVVLTAYAAELKCTNNELAGRSDFQDQYMMAMMF